MEIFQKRLRSRARELELSDAEVARRAGLSEGRYAHYVSGRNEPNLQTLASICRVLETTPSYVMGFEGDQRDKLSEEEQERKVLKDRANSAMNVLELDGHRIAVVLLEALVRHRKETV